MPRSWRGLDDLDNTPDVPHEDKDEDGLAGNADSPTRPYTGLGIYDARAEALTW
ncbi:hypothetical protein [Streptomyces sp. NPDC088762]|uniref:hypothetical protein n=1 Tax=Streptomyces sp. NPDC088762 TaxID=3365891 RepID=UPI003802242D